MKFNKNSVQQIIRLKAQVGYFEPNVSFIVFRFSFIIKHN